MPGLRDITVSIFGNRYTLRSDADPEKVAELAADVDARMREAAGAGGAAGVDRIAVLVALNLADELAHERQSISEEREQVDNRAGQILQLLSGEVGNEGSEGV